MTLTGVVGYGRKHVLLGPAGSGKSLMATRLAKTRGVDLGKKVISNAPFFFPDAKPGQVTQINLEIFKEKYMDADFWNESVTYFDEFQNWAPARRSSSNLNVAIVDWTNMIRKLNMDFIYSAQRWMNVDVVVREATDWRGICEYHPEIPCRKCKGTGIYKSQVCDRCKGFVDSETGLCSCGWAMVTFTPMRGRRVRKWIKAWGPDYYGFYDTKKLFSLPQKVLEFSTAEVY